MEGEKKTISRQCAVPSMGRSIASLQVFCRALVHRYSKLMRWEAAGRPMFLLLLILFIQKNLSKYLAWKRSQLQLEASAIALQTALRAASARRELTFRKQTRAAICIQARWRCRREFLNYVLLKKAALSCQCAWRQSMARRQLRHLRLANLDRARLHELCRLHELVHVLQLAVRDAETRVVEEREAARKAIEEAPPVIKETVVFVEDTERTNSLNAEVGRLKALLGAERKETFAARKAHAEAEHRNEELAELVGVAEEKTRLLQDALERVEEKACNLEAENKILRQAVASFPATKSSSRCPETTDLLQRTLEDEKTANGAMKLLSFDREDNFHDANAELPTPSDLEAAKQQQELLIKCLSEDLGFSTGRPMAAHVIYRCLVHWRSFEIERIAIFDRIIQKIGAVIEVRDNNNTLAYWLSNAFTLLLLLQRSLKTRRTVGSARQRRTTSSMKTPSENRAPQRANRPFLVGRLTGGLTEVRQVEAKYPALAFKQQLTALLEKVYGIIRHNLKKELSPFLGLCIQAPRTFGISSKGSCSQETELAQQASMAHWQGIIKILTNSLNVLKSNYVPPLLICKLFTQIFSFINVQLFNSLLLRRECCSLSNGEYVKAGLAELEHWCFWLTQEYAGSAWDELKHIRQAIGFLVLQQKHNKTLKEITDDLCPVLSIQQLYRISTMYCDDMYGTHGLPSNVISSMRAKMIESSSSPSFQDDINSFLLDDDFSIPFSMDDIAKLMMADTEAVADVDLMPLIQENTGFTFQI